MHAVSSIASFGTIEEWPSDESEVPFHGEEDAL
jgi:hypothetical protein